ncbi:MAG: hypothetical protein IIX92_05390 [Selenomonadales bacterium]|nr:hypothetical protein [Selenomonadales bacterium]
MGETDWSVANHKEVRGEVRNAREWSALCRMFERTYVRQVPTRGRVS